MGMSICVLQAMAYQMKVKRPMWRRESTQHINLTRGNKQEPTFPVRYCKRFEVHCGPCPKFMHFLSVILVRARSPLWLAADPSMRLQRWEEHCQARHLTQGPSYEDMTTRTACAWQTNLCMVLCLSGVSYSKYCMCIYHRSQVELASQHDTHRPLCDGCSKSNSNSSKSRSTAKPAQLDCPYNHHFPSKTQHRHHSEMASL